MSLQEHPQDSTEVAQEDAQTGVHPGTGDDPGTGDGIGPSETTMATGVGLAYACAAPQGEAAELVAMHVATQLAMQNIEEQNAIARAELEQELGNLQQELEAAKKKEAKAYRQAVAARNEELTTRINRRKSLGSSEDLQNIQCLDNKDSQRLQVEERKEKRNGKLGEGQLAEGAEAELLEGAEAELLEGAEKGSELLDSMSDKVTPATGLQSADPCFGVQCTDVGLGCTAYATHAMCPRHLGMPHALTMLHMPLHTGCVRWCRTAL